MDTDSVLSSCGYPAGSQNLARQKKDNLFSVPLQSWPGDRDPDRMSFLQNDSGASIVFTWVFALAMEFMIVYVYLLVTPSINLIADYMVEFGVPKHDVLWVQRDYAWGFGVLFIGVILWAIIWSHKKEEDTGWR
ncbi:MAG: hypothetical protein MPEBLZ_04358 [Candidatus Methanoperedens nitroreducens]|uniref:Uncharacterized protein n=1 Tax=Candidatus Methanoperedens nitratireducens TaxID=1392998 RepID=A0A0P7ZZQ9_9EURY|nr:hypothetical protein [Candidatus Methanoperedens sp. BLZ2]KAB2942414.1 MAG: hypothetical protein F9K14_17345 [Candidatus Methanoperedens sp.]KPQ41102.1 MAG: hypothetical protein MPEBLZ_04358 [Candidatus Methanoperedens sp. BLZ1]MBZ0176644.1 hypothetical protein [Candidatus Methanoperedens nitroreducens]MCX9080368.1 hypothetical protein [Candidatus Methanoperedens sp.]